MPPNHPAPTHPAPAAPAPGALSDRQRALVESDWQAVAPIAEAAAALFYRRLFELDPALRPLFPADLGEQGRKLMAALGLVVQGLRDSARLVPVLRGLGQRHAGYGVQAAHYATVGRALLWTLEQGLGPAFDAEHAAAWATAYGWVAATMQAGPLAAAAPGPRAAPALA